MIMKINEEITINDSIVTLKDVSTIMMEGIYRGSIPLLTKARSGSAQTNGILETRYNFINTLESQFPTIPGFTRKYILRMNENSSNSEVKVYFGGKQIATFAVWGANNDISMFTQYYDVSDVIKSLPTGHHNVTLTCAAWWYINCADVLIYDIPN